MELGTHLQGYAACEVTSRVAHLGFIHPEADEECAGSCGGQRIAARS